jgi:phytanoyl-CoA hydroxylase
MLTKEQCIQFQKNGFLVINNFTEKKYCQAIIEVVERDLNVDVQPIEYEADTNYPGAPTSREDAGGKTSRRLLQAYARSNVFADWARQEKLVRSLKQILGNEIVLSQAHHNCIMTKQARYSSSTGWHRDSRYWQFEKPELVTAWLALRDEVVGNGCLLVLPGSHSWNISPNQLNEKQFIREDLLENKTLIQQAIPVELQQGDLLFFSSNLFHAAGNNQTGQTKFSMVFTYRAKNNLPILGSRSASQLEIHL